MLQALMDGNQRVLVSMLEAGEWSVEANDLLIKVSESQTVVDMSMSPEARRLAIASASGVLGRAVKLRIVSGAKLAETKADKRNGGTPRTGTGNAIAGRGRAEQDAVVPPACRRNSGAEIRTVIDYKEEKVRSATGLRSLEWPPVADSRVSMGGFNLQEIMSESQVAVRRLAKKEMQETVVEASSGGGSVTAKMDGRKQLLSLRIDPEAVKSGDVEMLQDLVLAAVNEAGRKIDGAMQSSVGGMLGGLGL